MLPHQGSPLADPGEREALLMQQQQQYAAYAQRAEAGGGKEEEAQQWPVLAVWLASVALAVLLAGIARAACAYPPDLLARV